MYGTWKIFTGLIDLVFFSSNNGMGRKGRGGLLIRVLSTKSSVGLCIDLDSNKLILKLFLRYLGKFEQGPGIW